MILKILPSFPGRSCVKNTPFPLLAKNNQTVTTNRIGERQMSAINAIQKSKNLLKKCLYIKMVFLTRILFISYGVRAMCGYCKKLFGLLSNKKFLLSTLFVIINSDD